ncbi:STAS domain-containing protein [Poriferisphaera sp. WC338]|uniref:STAS domain-containing protein n=1 Tax=Poriferisphaera sp. WC338 TaxID=3425129 RepID=UPI003D8186C8
MPIQEWSDKILLVELGDDPVFSEEMDVVRAKLENCLAKSGGLPSGLPDIVVDLSEVEHVNSSNLSQLLRLRKMLIDGDVRLRLVGPTDAVWIVFMSTALDKVFEFRQDSATALAELQM